MLKKTFVIYDNGWKFKFEKRKTEPVTVHGSEIIAWCICIALSVKIAFFGY